MLVLRHRSRGKPRYYGAWNRTIGAFRDINPQAPTHVLVIPKTHYPDVAALAAAVAALLGEVIGVVQQVAAADAIPSPVPGSFSDTGAGRGPIRACARTSSAAGLLSWPPG